MTPLDKLKQTQINYNIIVLHANNHTRRKYIRSLITTELITHMYIDLNLSANEVAMTLRQLITGYKLTAGRVISILKQNNITHRGWTESANLPNVRLKYKQTCKQRFGGHPSSLERIKQLKREQCFEKYGVDNNFKSKEIKCKIKEFYQHNYGVDNVSESPLAGKSKYSYSKPHKLVIDILEKLNIPHICEKNMIFKKYNYTLEKEFNPRVDILLEQYKLVIEVNGSFWHANPKKYKPEDTFPTFYGKMSAKEIWLKDQIKKNHIESFGYIVETIWDDEITEENIINLLKRYENKTNN